jgi:ABC-type nickel/cobalt efflux system permease component RcnA
MNHPFPVSQAIAMMVLALFVLTVRTIAMRISKRSDEATESNPRSVSTAIQVSVTYAGVNRSWSLRPGASRTQAQTVANEVVHEILA